MLFEVAGIEVQPWVPPLVSLVISFFTSMGGVSGAFLLLPFQMSVLGYVNPSVSSTNQFYNIVAIPSGVWRFIREGRMVWPLTWVVIVGTLPGVFIGAFLRVQYLPDARNFKLFVAAVLLYIGVRMVRDLIKQMKGQAGIVRRILTGEAQGDLVAAEVVAELSDGTRLAAVITHESLRRLDIAVGAPVWASFGAFSVILNFG